MLKSICKIVRRSNSISIQEAVIKLKEVCRMQQELINKYDSEIAVVKRQCRLAIDKKVSKQEKLYYMRKIKIIQYHQESLRKRLLACTEKQYHLESLQLTVAHLDAIKGATYSMRSFMKESDVEKVEELQDNLADLISNACEIQNIVSQDINQDHDWDEEDLERELEDLSNDDTLWPEVPLESPSQSNYTEPNDIDSSTPLIQAPEIQLVNRNARKSELV